MALRSAELASDFTVSPCGRYTCLVSPWRCLMYCRRCGNEIGDNAAFCPRCGAAQDRQARPAPTTDSALIVLALIVFFPLGLYLMWRSHWEDDVKWAISGILLPPLWTRFVWRLPWSATVRGALTAALV